ncbi:hypothetical protein [Hydrogenobacter hydrogenophilus]|uniref:Uncharacterized protein n=1 Tax=Hydrogenobacter hydrogenophilus TaxID=35835 RepID=A0A285NZY3_9AQUI|nr:hypothetical protein [Hydrogenobacter hydrogenophilus]SNZ15030.1 hypothetical protein SAMN06265353_1261 [Hydrogenobacter hydrogenophilus]
MDWTQTITIIASFVGIISIVVVLLNKRIDDTNRRIDDLRQDIDRRLDKMEQEIDRRLDKIEQDIREIRQLLYKVFEVPHKEEK